MKNIAIFASGGGSNAENLANYFKESSLAKIAVVISDRKEAGVFERIKKYNIPALYADRESFTNGLLLEILENYKIDLIVLAGFLKLMPESIVNRYHNRIINIHPALLPKFGGKGMYGMNVHKAVVEKCETKTGITIHYVNSRYDEGEIIAAFETDVDKNDTPETVAAKIHSLEMKHFPVVIEKVILEM
jgi:phosphoribosylglycinamide formyltransferase 1